jgi:S1-C subfamily serine protease
LVGCSIFKVSNSEQPEPKSVVDDAIKDTVVFKKLFNDVYVPYCTGVVVQEVIVSAQHCIAQADASIRISLYDELELLFETEVLLEDVEQDISILRLKGINLESGRILSKEPPEWGAPVVVIGHPFGLTWSIVTGIISHPSRVGGPAGGSQHWFQVSAPTAPGSSGSPVFNTYGEVLGIVSFSAKDADFIVGTIHLDVLKRDISTVYRSK